MRRGHSDANSNNEVRAATIDFTDFATGSMGPKAEAARQFVRLTGGITGIGALGDALDFVEGAANTYFVPENINNKEKSNL